MVTSKEFFEQWEHSLSEDFQQNGVPAESAPWVSELVRIPVDSGETRVAALSHDNTLIAAGVGTEIRIYEVATSKLLRTLRGHAGQVGRLEFHPHGRKLASASSLTRLYPAPPQVRVWDLDVSDGHTDDFDAAARTAAATASSILQRKWSPEDHESTNLQKQIAERIVAAQSEIDVRNGRAFPGHLAHRAFSHDGRSLLYLGDNTVVTVLDVDTLTERKRLTGHTDMIMWAETSPDDTLIATSSWDKTTRIWSMKSGETLHVLRGATNQSWSGAFSPDGALVAAGEGDKMVRIWRVDTGELLHALGGFKGWVRNLSFSPDNRFLAAGAAGGTLKVFDVDSGESEQTWQLDLRKHSFAQAFLEIRHVEYTPRGDLFFSSTEGRSFGYRASQNWKWDLFEPGSEGLNHGTVAVSVDGSRLIVALGSTVGVWKVD